MTVFLCSFDNFNLHAQITSKSKQRILRLLSLACLRLRHPGCYVLFQLCYSPKKEIILKFPKDFPEKMFFPFLEI